MSSLGEIYFALGLDSHKFDEAIEKAKAEVAKLTGEATITASINADANKVVEQVQEELNRVTGKKAKMSLEIDNSSKASVEELVEDIRQAKTELERLKSSESWNTSAIERQSGFIKSLEKQLEQARAIKAAAVEANRAIQDVADPKVVQHIIDEQTINDVRSLTTAMSALNEQMEVSNRLREGQQKATAQNREEAKQRQAEREKERFSEQWLNQARKKNAEAAKAEAKAADEAASAEKEAAKKKANAAKESNRALQSQLNQLFRLEEAIRKLQNMRVALDTSDIDKDSENYKKATAVLDAYIDKLERLQGSGKTLDKREVSSVLGQDMRAMEAEVKSYTAAQKKIDKNFGGVSAQTEKAAKNTKKLSDWLMKGSTWATELHHQIGNAFSIYAVERFVRQLYTVGGEFQKQQIALRNMIGDAEKADVIFERVKDLSVKSPFTFSELASYTKQMSAYGIEYEELYDTTKRLADISAGVGVDMSRLILAYGQVRSAEVLRGQELRQFTEAGIPLVAELAKRLEEVRGKSVKVGEVFDAISKREISFGMVKDVLFDMTDPGGRFFQTQEELAESLAGKWSNLKDAWDIMLADIANGSNTTLAGMAEMTAVVLRNWEKWLPVIAGVTAALGTYRAVMTVVIPLQQAFNILTKANPWIALASGIVGAGVAIYGYATNSKSAAEEMKELNLEIDKNIQKHRENEQTANRYLESLKAQNTSEERRIKLYQELERMYPDVFESMGYEKTMLEDLITLKEKLADSTKKQSLAEYDESIRANNAEIDRLWREDWKRLTTPGRGDKHAQNDAEIKRLQSQNLQLQENRDALAKELEWKGKRDALNTLSTLQDYIDVYGEVGKAIKILKEGGITDKNLVNPDIAPTIEELNQSLRSALSSQEKIMDDFAPTTDTHKRAKDLAKVYKSAIKSIGGIFPVKSSDDNQNAKKAGEDFAKAFADGVKDEIGKIASQWDLYKQLFEKTGDMKFAASAFKTTHVWDDAAKEMHNALTEAAKSQGIDWDIDYDISDADAKTLYKDLYNSWKEIKDRIERNGVDLKVNAADAISESKDFAAQIEEIERKLQDKLQSLRVAYADDPEKLKRAEQEAISKTEEEKTKVRFEEFKKGSDWVKVFDDLDRVSDATLDNMIVKVEEFAKQAHLSEEVTKQLVEAMAKLRDKAIERNPFEGFKNAWGRLSYWKNYDVNAAYNKRYNDKTGKFEQKLSKEEIENLTKEANSDVVKASLGVIGKFDEVAKAADLLGGLFDSLGLSIGDTLGILSDVLGSAASGAKTGADIVDAFGIKNAGPWGAIAGAAIGMMSSLFASHDKALQREIEASEARAKEIERMSDNLESLLQRTMGGIYTFALDEDSKKNMQDLIDAMYVNDVLGNKAESNTKKMYSEETRKKAQEALYEDSYFDAQMATLMATRDELNEQLRLEQKKKNEDASKISDYEQEIKNIGIEIDNLANDMANTLYGIDFKDWTGRLAESLVDAWASGEDAVLAYKNTVDEILRDVGVSVISQQLIEERLAPIMDDFVAQFAKDNGEITSETMSILERMYGEAEWAADATEAYLEGLKKLGVDLADKSEEASGGLSKSVQGVTEDTANLLGSYLNAIRQSVHVKQGLLEKLVSDDVPRISYIAEAQLRELSQIQTNTAKNVALVGEIRDLVNRVVDKGSNKLKV